MALLTGKLWKCFSTLSVKDMQNYEISKDSLLKQYNLTKEGFKQKIRTAKPEVNEAPVQFIPRLKSHLMRWIMLANVTLDSDQLSNL